MHTSPLRLTAVAVVTLSSFFALAGCVFVTAAIQDDPAEEMSLTFALSWLAISSIVFAGAIALARSDPPPPTIIRSHARCACGYWLIGNESGQCPECREPVSPINAVHERAAAALNSMHEGTAQRPLSATALSGRTFC